MYFDNWKKGYLICKSETLFHEWVQLITLDYFDENKGFQKTFVGTQEMFGVTSYPDKDISELTNEDLRLFRKSEFRWFNFTLSQFTDEVEELYGYDKKIPIYAALIESSIVFIIPKDLYSILTLKYILLKDKEDVSVSF